MVDAARQLLNELMGRNRNLHPSEASREINWDDPDFCQYHIVKFCPHDLFINTRADLGPCVRIHDDEAKRMYEQARLTARKKQFEDEFLRFCNTMLNDVDRKIQKGKLRLQLMHRDQPMLGNHTHASKYQEQINNLNNRIKKLLSEAEEAGIRGDVDQAQDLMALSEKLKDEKDTIVAQYESISNGKEITATAPESEEKGDASPAKSEEEGEKKGLPWAQDMGSLPEKQMEVCETCGAFLIVGDAQQRIEDHLMGKQHLGYSKLRKAVEEIHEKRQKEREEDERRRREERPQRPSHSFENERRRDFRDHRVRERDYRSDSRGHIGRNSAERHRHHHKSHRRRSHSRSSSSRKSQRSSRERYSRSRSRSRY